ncbi:MAG: hypothetical protein HGJ94_13110 [Desulfosarcina sp.]|nr:hypothetical protein [Desulfosarcina sp.]MBC2743724.1 hypothetical protein [Desulfosarcina sp.]MBC2766633.1 hypothetical protein [Desulfosarcina sp.]
MDAPLTPQALIDNLKARMEAVKAEIHVVSSAQWIDAFLNPGKIIALKV